MEKILYFNLDTDQNSVKKAKKLRNLINNADQPQKFLRELEKENIEKAGEYHQKSEREIRKIFEDNKKFIKE